MKEPNNIAAILKALHFAADKHRNQRRKDVEASPYINHPIELAELLARVGEVTDLVTLQGAILHDTVEDTETTFQELEENFGAEVTEVVKNVTDDKTLPKEERKRLQIEHAPHLPERAKQVKIADKISNVLGVTKAPPADWSLEQRQEYLDWTEKVVKGCRGCNPALENHYDEVLQMGLQQLEFLKRDTTQEQPTPLREEKSLKMTPEEMQMIADRRKEISELVIEGCTRTTRKSSGRIT